MRTAILALLLAGATADAQTPSGKPDLDPIVLITDEVAGRGLPHYANAWWQWAFSMPQSESPVRDQTGVHCALNQEGPVWFLAGGFGSSRIFRTCTVPVGKHIFFPLINMLEYTPAGSDRDCARVKAASAANNDRYVQLRAMLNDVPLEGLADNRISSEECFDPLERVPDIYAPPSWYPAATDGYWLMLRPLPAGEHVLSFQAFYTNQGTTYGDMVQNITYRLQVTDE